jgi:hypothetical protein
MTRFTLILMIFTSIALIAAPTLAQEPVGLTLAAVENHNVWLFSYKVDPQQITDGTAHDYTHLVWSANKHYLAFVALSEDFSADLWIYNHIEGALQQVDSNVLATFPPSFDADNSQLLYFKDTMPPGNTEDNRVGIYSYNLAGNLDATQFATVDLGAGCGGGSSFPADWLYWDETGGLGGFHPVLESTFAGIVYSKDCGYSTALLDRATHEEVSLGNLSRVAISPDQTELAAITYLPANRSREELVVIDLATLATTLVGTTEIPDQVVWGAAESSELFYSTRQMTNIMPEFFSTELARLDAMLDNRNQLNLWEVSIHRVELRANIDSEIYRADAYAIGKLMAVSDSNALLFSQIGNAREWFAQVASGRLDHSDPVQYEDSGALVPVHLFRLPIGGEPELLGENLYQVAAIAK